MLTSRSQRRQREGRPPLDVDAEMRTLLLGRGHDASPLDGDADGLQRHDPQLIEELRQLVAAANARRARRGEPPLDPALEITRRLKELDD